MKLLIIDDDTDLLDVIARRICRKGIQTLCATNLTQALELFLQNPDISGIICDLFLKDGENGIVFYEQHVKDKFKGKFILATGNSSADARIVKYSREDKLFYCMEKPYSINEAVQILSV
ncbi:MAG: response regulator [Bdellovibrionota bacterium]